MTITSHQVLKSAVGISLGAGLGLFCWAVLDYGAGWALLIGALGSFIGFALSLPGVSAERVAGATIEMFIGYNPVEGPPAEGGIHQVTGKTKRSESSSSDPQRDSSR